MVAFRDMIKDGGWMGIGMRKVSELNSDHSWAVAVTRGVWIALFQNKMIWKSAHQSGYIVVYFFGCAFEPFRFSSTLHILIHQLIKNRVQLHKVLGDGALVGHLEFWRMAPMWATKWCFTKNGMHQALVKIQWQLLEIIYLLKVPMGNNDGSLEHFSKHGSKSNVHYQ